MDLKAKKESLSKQYNDLTKTINKSLDMRSRVLGALELLHQIMENCKKCEHGCHCSNGGSCTSCECKDCDCKDVDSPSDIETGKVQSELNFN